jgi:regulator of sigma E protease
MIDGLISFFLALIGLGFLVLIHEAGHYIMARRAGMRVEVFGIGFGRPLFSFLHKGVRINICWIPFGGYVKIAGMEAKKGETLYKAPDGFFAKSPLARIKVALCGPVANILFALIAFSLIWVTGGREKTFSDVSGRIGWIDPNSELYEKGVRPGDLILSYNGKPVRSAKDHFYAAMTSGPQLSVEVEKLGATKGESRHLTVDVKPYQHPLALEKGILTTGVLAPASFLVWNMPKEGPVHFISEAQEKSGIMPSDRLMWVDGEFLVSQMQLSSLLNDGCLFVSVLRDGKYLNLHIPRLSVGELKLSTDLRGEISDWQYESKLEAIRTNQLWFLPYNLTSDGTVEGEISLLDNEAKAKEGQKLLYHDVLLPHDRIVAVAGRSVSSAAEILRAFQEKHVLVIVDRTQTLKNSLGSQDADALFKAAYQSPQLSQLVQAIGTPEQMQHNGAFVLLNPIAPKTRNELLEDSGRKEEVIALKEEEERFLQAIEDPQMRLQARENLQLRDRQLFLGLSGVHDKAVLYNPSPLAVCSSIGDEISQTITALFGGYLSPRWMSGPVGILHVIQQQWSIGYKEALFWLGTISLNLAILNLIPLPVLDGGYVLLSLFEMGTGVRLKVETVEKIVFPFAILLIILLVYLTYHDLVRLFANVFSNLSVWKGG